jgi:hypothetical protein
MALAGSVAWAAIPGPGGVIQGCYDAGGNVKVVDALPCPARYTPFQWNQQGIQGPKGDKGDRGDTGPQGPAGSSGASNAVTYSAFATGGSSAYKEVYCPAGQRAVGGGVIAGPGDAVGIDAPVKDGGFLTTDGEAATGWAGSVSDGALIGASTSVRVTVVCAP